MIRTIGIRGAGLSGLSVAQELLRSNPNLSISVFDIRPQLPHPQRTFCFFRTSAEQERGVPSVEWKKVMFRGPSFERRLDVSMSPYTMIRGDDFFAHTLDELEAGGVSFLFDCRDVSVHGNSLRVDGKLRPFDRVIDAAFDPRCATSLMWQSFAGVWISTEDAFFDPATAILMDLQDGSPEAPVSFLYVLPTSPHTALVEHTTFSQQAMSKEYHLDRCYEWLRTRVGEAYRIEEFERGAIPMGLRVATAADTIRVGSNAGAVRPATGYAFAAAREHAQRVSRTILGHQDGQGPIYPRWLERADTLFLHALLRAPERGSALMERLLARSRGDALISFLSGQLNLGDALSIWLSVPKISMIRSLLRV